MRKILYALKAAGIFALCLVCAAALLLLTHAPAFEMGEAYEVYYGASSSSLMRQTDAPLLEKLGGNVAGESVRYAGDRYEELKERYRARLLFTEEAGGTVNYYLYSPLLGDGVEICGHCVNLHIAVREGTTAAGTPLIFGGF